MTGPLEDLFKTRTERNHKGTLASTWENTLLLRDLERLMAERLMSKVVPPRRLELNTRACKFFRDNVTGEIYVYVEGWERGSAEFRRAEE